MDRFGIASSVTPRTEMVLHRSEPRVKEAREILHLAEAFAQTQAVLNTALGAVVELQTGVDSTRGVWRAWTGGEGFDRAKYKGEWGNELGALRRLRNAALNRSQSEPVIHRTSQETRPAPGGGSTSMLDTLAQRRQHSSEPHSFVKRTMSWMLYIVLFGLLFSGLTVGAWESFLRELVTRRPVAATPHPIVPVAAEPSTPDPVVDEEFFPPARGALSPRTRSAPRVH